ncbi:MAG: hypothetical protein EA401_07555, partial [Planctomycetota bacterium]
RAAQSSPWVRNSRFAVYALDAKSASFRAFMQAARESGDPGGKQLYVAPMSVLSEKRGLRTR